MKNQQSYDVGHRHIHEAVYADNEAESKISGLASMGSSSKIASKQSAASSSLINTIKVTNDESHSANIELISFEESVAFAGESASEPETSIRENMPMHPNHPLTFKGAIVMAGSALLITGAALWAAYVQVQGQISDVRGEVSDLRSTNHNDMNRLADKLDDINKTLNSMQVEIATMKTRSEIEKKQ